MVECPLLSCPVHFPHQPSLQTLKAHAPLMNTHLISFLNHHYPGPLLVNLTVTALATPSTLPTSTNRCPQWPAKDVISFCMINLKVSFYISAVSLVSSMVGVMYTNILVKNVATYKWDLVYLRGTPRKFTVDHSIHRGHVGHVRL